MTTEQTTLAIIPEGPLAFDGKSYLYSEGECYYIDRIAAHFKHITLIAHAFKPGNTYYKAVAHRPFTAGNISVIELPLKSGLPGKLLQLLLSAKTIWQNLNKADVFYIFLPGYAGALGALFCRLRRKPYFLYLASDWPEEAAFLNPVKGGTGKLLLPVYRWLIGWLQDNAVRGARFTMTAGTLLKDKYANAKGPVEETIPRLNWPDYKIYERRDTCENEPVTLLFVGYLLERKGASYFIEAIKNLRDQGRHVRGVLIGEGEQEETLRGFIKENSLEEAIDMKGHIPNGAPLIEEYRKADIFIFPSCSGEGFPRVLYEAMSQGLPIVSSDICGIPGKLGRDKEALFVPPEDSIAISEQVARLLDDPALRQSLIANGRTFMEKLINGGDGGEQIAKLYEKHVK